MSFGQFVLVYVSGMCGLAGLRQLVLALPAPPWHRPRAARPVREIEAAPPVDARPAPRTAPRPAGADPDLVRYTGRRPAPVSVLLPRTVLAGRASVQADGGGAGRVTVRAASCRGSGHMREGLPRQDAFLVGASADGRWVIAAVADGVGSTAHAEVAAQAAVAAAVRHTERALERGGIGPRAWARIFGRVADEVGERMRPLGGTGGPRPPGRTTLTILAAPAEQRPGCTVHVAGVGDSPALRLRPTAAEWSLVLGPDRPPGNVRDDVTAALPPGLDDLRTTTCEWRPDEVLVLATDGFANALGNRSELSMALADEWARPPDLLGFIRDVDFRRATFTDDRTVVALWPGTHDRRH
ncbi:protein phosphatase 2C domain-containing protein [Actinomadura formosensis]|uniref:protein phosphatase 2C domain-containing protein n=2 Tax=Actinomadura formosensis TaxID=60706 RepID=UPI001041052B|nr:protein phosphatase 2C domain-containing protein [Actinomadura formosensis]